MHHLTFDLGEDPVSTSVDGLGHGCPDFTGILEEDRSLHVSGIMKADGTGHATTDVDARVTLTPTDPDAVGYVGWYSQHQSGFFVEGGQDDHLSVDAQGEVRAWFDRFRCMG